MTVINGTDHDAAMSVERYAEVIGSATTARDVPSGRTVDLTTDVPLQPHDALILQF